MPADEPDPPRKFYELKPKEFERVNPPAPEAAPAPPPEADAGPPIPDGPVIIADFFRQPRPRAPGENDVHDILRENLERANAAGLNKFVLRPPRPSRRKRDYLVAMGLGNGFFLSIALIWHGTPLLFVSGLSGAVLFTVGTTWIMWSIMDHY